MKLTDEQESCLDAFITDLEKATESGSYPRFANKVNPLQSDKVVNNNENLFTALCWALLKRNNGIDLDTAQVRLKFKSLPREVKELHSIFLTHPKVDKIRKLCHALKKAVGD
jgi:hypothetical protein